MINYNPDTYCSLAFAGFDTRVKSVCCWAKIPKVNSSFNQVMSDPNIQKIQQDLLNGVQNKTCHNCWYEESIGLTSMRLSFLKNKTDEIIREEIAQKKLKHLVIDSGNVCNLACRTCGPASSSAHFKEAEEKSIRFNGKKESWFKVIKKTDLEYLKFEDYSQLRTISILGGEPFQNLEHLKVLEAIISQGYASNCSLHYTTNGTISISQKIKNILIQFKSVLFTLSIDGVGKSFEYIRTNGQWDSVLSTVADLKELASTHSNIQLATHPTISALNIFHLDELYSWFKENKLYHTIVFCNWPEAYSFNIFNQAQKDFILEKLNQSTFNMGTIIQHINQSSFSQDALDNFWKETEFTTDFKGLDINEYFPELIQLLKLK